MKYRKKLFSVKNPYAGDNDDLFFKATKENFRYQIKRCGDYAEIAAAFGVGEKSLSDYGDLEKIPVIPTLFFKRHRLKTSKGFVTVTSSGTSGHYSEISYDFGGLFCALKMALKVVSRRKLISATPCHYIIMGYKMHRGNRTGVAKTAFITTLLTPSLGRKYVLKYRDGAYRPDFDGIIAALEKYEKSKFPVRFMGFPAYTYFLMKTMEERGVHVKLPKNSMIMLGGGWKQFYTEETDKQSFYRLAERILGISEDKIVEFFGAVEHPILYCDCPYHHFHVPAYGRIIIRDPDTLEPVENGKTGLVNLLTPMIKATPLISVMTDDLGILHDGSECPCGQKTPYLEIVGRIAPADIKTCAAGAADILKEVKL